jgi:outer membrane protein
MGPRIFAAALCAATLPFAAAAQDGFFSAKSDGDWLIRGRALAVIPNESANFNPPVAGGDVSISTAVVPELDITYFFTPNIAAELILGVTPHDVSGRGPGLGGADIGSVWLLPPTLTLQYHVTQLGDWLGHPHGSRIKPYVGAGVNYTMFFDEDAGQFNDIEYDDSFGLALQAGVDFELAEGFYLNVDAKYIFLNTDVSVDNGTVTGDVDINPLLIGVGLGYRF